MHAEKNIFLEGNKFLSFIEFEGFLIAVTCSSSQRGIKHEVVACKSYQVLHGLGDVIFSQKDLEVDTAFLGKFDGNRMWLVSLATLATLTMVIFIMHIRM